MIHRVKRYGEIYEDEQDHLRVTRGTDDVVLYPEHCCLSAMIHGVCRLEFQRVRVDCSPSDGG